MDPIVVHVRIEGNAGILAGCAGVDAVEEMVYFVPAHYRPDVTADEDAGPLHVCTLHRIRGPFRGAGVVDLVEFDTGIVALRVCPRPIGENAGEDVVDFVPADDDMRRIVQAYA